MLAGFRFTDPVGWPGGDRLSRSLSCSTMGAGVFHVRVRDGIGCIIPAMTTGPPNRILGLGWDGWFGVLGCVCGVRGLVLRAVLVAF